MATSITVKDQVNQYLHKLVVTVLSQNVDANTTRVSYEYTVTRSGPSVNGAWTELNNVTFTATINGVAHTATPNFDFRTQSVYTMVEGEQTISHGSDGIKNISVRLQGTDVPGSIYFQDADSGNKTFVITPIPRGSDFTLEPPSVIVGGSTVIDIHRVDSSYTHTVEWESDTDSGVIGTGVATSATFTPDPSILGSLPSVGISIKVTTFDGADQVGEPTEHDLVMRQVPVYPEVSLNTPYDLRFRRMQLASGRLVIKEEIPFIAATLTDTLSSSGACTLSVSKLNYDADLEDAVVLAQVYDGSQWISGDHIFVLTRTENDTADLSEVVSYTGLSFVDFLLSKGMVAYNPKETTRTPGYFLNAYIDYARDRGWAPLLSRSFTDTKTSAGTKWARSPELNISRDTPIAQVLEGMVTDVYAEYRTHYRDSNGRVYLDMYNVGYGVDWTVAAADPVVNISFAGLNKVVDRAPVRKDSAEKLTRVFVRGEGKRSATRESDVAVNPVFGHLEGSAEASGVKKTEKLNSLGDAILKQSRESTVERTFNYDLASPETPTQLYPYRTFRTGDWILIPGDNGMERSRISQINLSKDSEGMTATLTMGDLIPSGIAATARKLAQKGGSALSAGSLTGTPAPLSSTIPSAPLNVVVTTDGYWDPTGAPKAGILVTWNDVTTSIEGNSLDVDLYEVWTRATFADPWVLAMLSDTTEAALNNLNINQSMDVQLRARTDDGTYGEWSDPVSVTTPVPDETLPAPSNPILEVDALGTVTVTWNGLIGGVAPPLWFSYLQAEISDSEFGAYSYAGQQLVSGGSVSVANVGAGTWWFRLVAYDTLNVRGAESSAVSIVVVPLAIDTREPKAPENVTVTSEGSWNGAAAESKITVEWDAVTEGIDNDPIDIGLYEVWGKLSTDLNFSVLGSTDATSIVVQPMTPLGATWDIKVRAQGINNVFSAFSAEESVVVDAPDMAMLPPTLPSLNSQSGLLIVSWDGQVVDDTIPETFPAPDYLSNVNIEVSVDEGTEWSDVGFLVRGDRTATVGALNVGTTVWVRLVGYDILGQASDPSDVAIITIEGIDGADLIAGTVTANAIAAGSINVNHVEPNFGNDLDISANGTVTIIAGQAQNAQDTADTNGDNLAAMRTRYDFTPTEALISQPGSAFQVAISNTQLEFRESGVARAYLNAGVFNAPRMASTQLVLKYQEIADDPAGTVIRRI